MKHVDRIRSVRAAFGLCTSLVLFIPGCTPAEEGVPVDPLTTPGRDVDLSAFFGGGEPVEATFVMLDGATGEVTRFNPARARERFLPASTLKIANSLIALETQVADGPDYTIAYDSATMRTPGFWSPAWSRDQTLRSAFQASVVWYYRALAREIGRLRMSEYLERFDYGNREIGGAIDDFWLDGTLRISPEEQVCFLQRLYTGDLGVSPASVQAVKDIMVLEETPGYRLSEKTGTADMILPTRELAWLVGFAERDRKVWFYALNMEGEEVWERWGESAERRKLVVDILEHLGALEP